MGACPGAEVAERTPGETVSVGPHLVKTVLYFENSI